MDRQTLALGDTQVSCKNCKKTFTPDSTSDSFHLERYYPNVDHLCACSVSSESETYVPTKVKLDKLARVLCEYVVSKELPFGIFEQPGFKALKDLASAVFPKFNTVITKKALLRDALANHQTERMIVESELSNTPGRICFEIDKWGNQCTVEEYMCITACWIDHNWRLQKRIIRLFGLVPDDSVALANEIVSSLGQWNVADKVFGFILDDDASYCDSLIASLKSHFQGENALVLSGKFCHAHSYSSIIHLLGQASLKLMDDVLPKIRNTLTHLKLSIPKRKKFYEAARINFGLDTTKRLCLDSFTTWDSTFLMLDSFLYYRDVLVEFVSNDMAIQVYCLTQEEWALVDEIHKFLKEIDAVIKDLSASKKSDASFYFFAVWEIHMKLLDISNGPPSIISGLVKKMQAELEKYLSDFGHILACAAVLDPRCKVDGVHYCYEKVYGEFRAEEMIVALKKMLFDLFEEYKQIYAVTSPRAGTSNVSNSNNDRSNRRMSRFHEYIMKQSEARRKNRSELQAYFEAERASILEDLDLLEYWNKYSGYYGPYRVLSIMARDVLTMTISMAPLDSGFSL